MIPLVLLAEAETLGTALDNLGRAERLGWLPSLVDWTGARALRNRIVHECMENLERGKQLVSILLNTVGNSVVFAG